MAERVVQGSLVEFSSGRICRARLCPHITQRLLLWELQGAPLYAELQSGFGEVSAPDAGAAACACSRALPSSSERGLAAWSGGLAQRGDSSAWSLGALVAQGPGSLVVVLLLLLLLLLAACRSLDRHLQSLWFCLLSLGEDND